MVRFKLTKIDWINSEKTKLKTKLCLNVGEELLNKAMNFDASKPGKWHLTNAEISILTAANVLA